VVAEARRPYIEGRISIPATPTKGSQSHITSRLINGRKEGLNTPETRRHGAGTTSVARKSRQGHGVTELLEQILNSSGEGRGERAMPTDLPVMGLGGQVPPAGGVCKSNWKWICGDGEA